MAGLRQESKESIWPLYCHNLTHRGASSKLLQIRSMKWTRDWGDWSWMECPGKFLYSLSIYSTYWITYLTFQTCHHGCSYESWEKSHWSHRMSILRKPEAENVPLQRTQSKSLSNLNSEFLNILSTFFSLFLLAKYFLVITTLQLTTESAKSGLSWENRME